MRGTVPGKRSGASLRQPGERRQVTERQIGRPPDGGADRQARGFDRDRPPAGHGIHEQLGSRVPSRQHDELCRHRLAQRRGSRRYPRAASMARAEPDVDPDDGAAAVRRAGAPDHEYDVRRIGVDLCRHPARRKRLDDRVLHHAAQLQRRRLEILRRSEIHREPQARRRRQSIVRCQRRQELPEQRFEPHRRAREQVPRDARGGAVMTRRHPCDAGVERIKESGLTLAFRFGEGDVER